MKNNGRKYLKFEKVNKSNVKKWLSHRPLKSLY